MSLLNERLRLVADIKIPKKFDGTKVWERFISTGKWILNYEDDMNLVRKDSSEFLTDQDALDFLIKQGKSDGSTGSS